MARTRLNLSRILLCLGLLLNPIAFAPGAMAQVSETYGSQIANYNHQIRVARLVQDYAGAHKPCLDERNTELISRSILLEQQLGESLTREQHLSSEVAAQTVAYQQYLAAFQDEQAKLPALVTEEAKWNKSHQNYLSYKDACARALKGEWGAMHVCNAGALAPGNRSFEVPLSAARQRLATAQSSVSATRANLDASQAALSAAQIEAASTRTEIVRTGAEIASIKADLSEIRTLTYATQSVFEDFAAQLNAASKVDQADQRPRTLRILAGYAEKITVTTARGRALIATADRTLGKDRLRACGLL